MKPVLVTGFFLVRSRPAMIEFDTSLHDIERQFQERLRRERRFAITIGIVAVLFGVVAGFLLAWMH